MRYKLIPTRGRGSFYIESSSLHVSRLAEDHWLETGVPVLVVEAPEGGIVRRVGIVGQDDPRKVRR